MFQVICCDSQIWTWFGGPAKTDLSLTGVFDVDFCCIYLKLVKLQKVPSVFWDSISVKCWRYTLYWSYHITWKISIFYQGIFTGYHVCKGAFCYAILGGDRPRCRSPPSALMFVPYLKQSLQMKGNYYEC